MKRVLGLICLVMLTGSAGAHEIDSLYGAFLTSRGDNALRLANEIVAMMGDTVGFTPETPSEVMNDELLKTMIYWHFDHAEMMEVISYSNKAIEVYRQKEDLFNMAGCYNTLGVAYQRMGQLEEAIDSYNRCNELMTQLNQQEANPFYEKNIRYTINNMASIYCSMGEFDMAEDMFSKCINSLGQLESDQDYLDMATYSQNLADVYLSQAKQLEGRRSIEKIEKAVDLAEMSLDYTRKHGGKPKQINQRMLVVSRAYHAAERDEEAFAMMEEALHLAKSENDVFLEAEIESMYGQYYFDQKQYKEAETHYLRAIEISQEGHFDECLLNAYRGASEASRQFDPVKALEYYEKSTALKDSIFNENQQALLRDYQVKYDLAEKEHQLEIQQKNNKAKTSEIIILVAFLGLFIVIMVILVRLIRIRKKQNETLARLNDTQNRILSVASHNVKNSVIAQNMVLKLANEHFDSLSRDELKENLAALKTGSDELKDKLYTILHWIYGELGKEATPSVSFNLLQTVEEGVKPHVEELKAKDLVVVNDIAPQLQCFDKVNVFNIVFQNLFTNAIKFSKEGGEITVRAVEDGKQVWVEVVDHGIGISQQRMQELMHDKVTPTTGTFGERGTGIGLFVSRQLMVKNCGQLLIDSVEGQGTTIKFNVKKY